MAKERRRASRLAKRRKRAAAYSRPERQARLLRRLALVALAGVAMLIVSGRGSQEARFLVSSPVNASESGRADRASQRLVSLVPKSDRALRSRWEDLQERRNRIQGDTARLALPQTMIPSLPAGTSAARISSKPARSMVPAVDQMRRLANSGGVHPRSFERFEARERRGR